MKCPACHTGQLQDVQLEPGLAAKQCQQCHGHWLLIEDFAPWAKNQSTNAATAPAEVTELADDSSKALFCPQTGTIMRKLRIQHDIDHRLDYSSRVGGVWLDKGEWQLLQQHGLALRLNHLLTDSWQQQIKDEQAKAVFGRQYANKFGAADYAQLQQVRQWLDSNANKRELLAYLQAEDPYSARR